MDFLAGRRIQPERLDVASDEEAAANLGDLRRINRWLGGHSVLRGCLRRWYRRGDGFRMLDIGAASGDTAGVVKKAFPGARVVSLDHMLRNLRLAPEPKLAADAFRLPFAEGSFDVVGCSLFLHHFEDEDVVRLLKEMGRVSRGHVLAIDLERRWLARQFLPATGWLLGWNEVTLHDGPVSVEAAFRAEELRRLGEAAGLQGVRVRAHYPWFRLSLRGRVRRLRRPCV
ncbi:MAG: methyltransferase domain-containing protein [Acidobacteria bacterium]|nr:methyltransferase domain-containing protein [Acidobacteriota bacterium]